MNTDTFPSFAEAQRYVGDYRTVPVARTVLADSRTPIQVLRALQAVSPNCFILESLEDSARRGRYTFLGYAPRLELTALAGTLTITRYDDAATSSRAASRRLTNEQASEADVAATTETFTDAHPAEHIRAILAENSAPRIDGMPPFTGGLMGYFAYESIRYAEPSLTFDTLDDEGFNDIDLMLFDKIVAFDHLRQTVTLITQARTDNLADTYPAAVAELDAMVHLVLHGEPAPARPLRLGGDFTELHSREKYAGMVEAARRHIYEGDIFQAVLSNRLSAPAEGSLLDAYRLLRSRNPSPYMFYISSPVLEIAGSSPETLVKLTDGVARTYPLAGTRPRGATESEDRALEAELLADPKELAEHNMLVDLGRNDVGRVCSFGSVDVEEYLKIVRYSHVMHIASAVRGRLREDADALDALAAVLPAGTLSGAPKIRACEIIADLEGVRRGVYGGAIGYFDFTGNMDTAIAIRLAYAKGGRVVVRSGAGVVADSVPTKEYDECRNKAAAVLAAVRDSEGGVGA